jgi:hypothetical protein
MSSTWELVGICFADANRAEELVHELAFRRELRVEPEKALAAFALWRRPALGAAPRSEAVASRRMHGQLATVAVRNGK